MPVKAGPVMRIDVGKLKNVKGGMESFALTESLDGSAWGYDELLFATPVNISGQVANQDGLLVVTATAQGQLELRCNRCLQSFRHPFSVDIAENFSNRPDVVEAAGEDEVHAFDGNFLELTEPLLKEIYLSLPMQIVCHEDCRGLCPGCGVNLNEEPCRCTEVDIDPRFEKLLSFMKPE